MKNDINIIAMDLDDTLLKHDLSISPRTIATIKKASDKGIKIILASGRSAESMFGYAEQLNLHDTNSYLICNNGSQTLRSDTRETVSEHKLPVDLALEIFHKAICLGLACHIYENNSIFVSKETVYSQRDFEFNGFKPVVLDDFDTLIRKGVFKLLFTGDPDLVAEIETQFKEQYRCRANVFVSKPFFLEVLPVTAGKGEALKEIAETIMGLSHINVMAFGDSMNDESMIRYAGHSVAMINSRVEILALARHVTEKTNDEDGVAAFVDKHILG